METKKCSHLMVTENSSPRSTVCEECSEEGLEWVELRACLTCGHVGCCDSSVGKHATKHFEETGHPIMQSYRTDDEWMWCYVDKMYVSS